MIAFLQEIAAITIGVLLAAAVGIPVALTRLRKERAFDRRLEWAEETADVLSALAVVIPRAAALRAEGKTDNEFAKYGLELGQQFRKCAAAASLYAPPDVAIELVRTLRQMPLSEGFSEETAREASRGCHQAAKQLSPVVRKWLGMKPLPEGWDRPSEPKARVRK